MPRSLRLLLLLMAAAAAVWMAGCFHDPDTGTADLRRSGQLWEADSLTEAYRLAQRALVSFEQTGNLEGAGQARMRIALFYYLSGLLDDAYQALCDISPAEAATLRGDDHDNYVLLMAYLTGYCRGDFDTAMAYCDSLTAIHQATEPDNRALHYLDLNNIVEIHTLRGDTARAWQMIRAMEADPIEPDPEYYRHQMNINKTRLYLLAQQYDSAARYAGEVLAGGLRPVE